MVLCSSGFLSWRGWLKPLVILYLGLDLLVDHHKVMVAKGHKVAFATLHLGVVLGSCWSAGVVA
jgi:hypothetical protein